MYVVILLLIVSVVGYFSLKYYVRSIIFGEKVLFNLKLIFKDDSVKVICSKCNKVINRAMKGSQVCTRCYHLF